MAHAAMGMELLAVIGNDAGRFLAAMLQGVEAERGEGRGFGMAEDAEHAAFLMRVVIFEGQGAQPRFSHAWLAGALP
jgi:hypothetical protein